MTGRRSIFARVLVIALSVALLSGCSREASDLHPSTAKELQSAVVGVAQSAADGNLSGALAQLDALESSLRQETAAGAITGDRSARIEAAIEVVRSDLEERLAASTPTPTPSPTTPAKDEKGHDKGGKGGKGDKGP